MGEQRQRYNEEFKRQTVRFVQEQTKSLSDLSEELNIPKSTLSQWMTQYRQFEKEPVVNHPEKIKLLEQSLKDAELENRRKERELEDMKEELAILKKALHIFSKAKN
ncbi:transposase [Paenibacillus lycopersici]|uniref:Transposase n=1 Tax=Paenibacillus lycopersici TaxID=2704462 RepID=A0A6C0FUA3_9BACL|nr:transposase [Paenibacillus lycopersici]QHT59041.1 transposase [Paenibacillus lycopersici]QHT60052.1 transposase [Paenibacillus lycopersici]QHT60850.1 transposase [Paenibacillus lycopersici]